MPSKRCATSAKTSGNYSSAPVTNPMACQSRCEIRVQASRRRLSSAFSWASTRRSPTAWAWAYLSAARSSKPTADRCGRSRASRGAPSFSLRSPLTELLSVIDVAYWQIAGPDVCDGTSAVGESRHRIPGASVGQPTEPCLAVRRVFEASEQAQGGRRERDRRRRGGGSRSHDFARPPCTSRAAQLILVAERFGSKSDL